MYSNYTFDGGSYRHKELIELVEDLGGYVISKYILSNEATITFTVPSPDMPRIEVLAKELGGKIKNTPLLGTEIAVVTPTLTRHHLPHPLCDIAEFLRRGGANTNMIGLARGTGRRTAQISQRERDLIEEHDVAVVALGNFKRCIDEKIGIFLDLNVPLVISALPYPYEVSGCEYVPRMGKFPYKFKQIGELKILDEISSAVERCLNHRREEIMLDPPVVPPFVVKDEIEQQVEEAKYIMSPGGIALRLNGLRVKLPFDVCSDAILQVRVAGFTVGEICTIERSRLHNHILLDMRPRSMVESAFESTMQAEKISVLGEV